MFDTSIKNKRKTYIIMALFIAIVTFIAYFISYYFELGEFGVIIAMSVAIMTSIGAYYNSDKIILSMSKAKPATKEQNQRMVENLEGLCIAAGLPMPKLYIIEDGSPNAFATGRDPSHAVICVTTGLLSKLNDYELEGVLAHELSHIKNYDILLQTIATVLVGFLTIISDIIFRYSFRRSGKRDRNNGSGIIMIVGLIFLILSPIAASLLRLALSRNREFYADSSAIELTRNPQGLIDALIKISSDDDPLDNIVEGTESLYICSPLKGKKASSLLSTHPPIEARIEALKNIS